MRDKRFRPLADDAELPTSNGRIGCGNQHTRGAVAAHTIGIRR